MQFVDFGALIPIVAILSSVGFGFIWLRYHELKIESRRLERDAGVTADEKRALEKRLAVLERIVTDAGVRSAGELEAIRERESEQLR